ncbi:MAG: subclass B3 metallo-beta-lactamase [Steroidobacteraceae bacterium]
MNIRQHALWLFGLAGCLIGWSSVALADDTPCSSCANWNVSQPPFKIYGDTYYVGTHGLSSVFIASSSGHVLIDGALPESAPKIAANIRELGFRIEDVKVILNSHVHFDHAGGLAELQRLSGAKVYASRSSAAVLRSGVAGRDDPQYAIARPIARIKEVSTVKEGDVVRVGSLQLTAHMTPGHTPGGTSWSWQSCESKRCLNMVYADSLSSVSAEEFKYTRSSEYPGGIQDFAKSFATLTAMPCDILITPHPEASGLWKKLERRQHGAPDPFVDVNACRAYVDMAREGLAKRLDSEKASP